MSHQTFLQNLNMQGKVIPPSQVETCKVKPLPPSQVDPQWWLSRVPWAFVSATKSHRQRAWATIVLWQNKNISPSSISCRLLTPSQPCRSFQGETHQTLLDQSNTIQTTKKNFPGSNNSVKCVQAGKSPKLKCCLDQICLFYWCHAHFQICRPE